MSAPLPRAPVNQQQTLPNGFGTRALEAFERDVEKRLTDLKTNTTIADADGTLADLTTKFNALLAALRGADVLS